MNHHSTDTRLPFREIALTFVIVISVVADAGVVAAGGDDGRDGDVNGATEIDSCTVIDDPGRYVLTENIEDSEANVCIDIRASDVHFDVTGHTVDGVQTESILNETAQGPSRHPRTSPSVPVSAFRVNSRT